MIRAGLSFLALGLAAGALAPVADAAPARKAAPVRRAAAAVDWTRTVVMTPEGGFRMGNPAAKVKLVEYASLTCSHCAAFSRDGMPRLKADWIRTGKVSYEFRHYLFNGLDASASLLARCGGPARFFALAERFYAAQGQWSGRVAALPAAQKNEIEALPVGRQLVRYADVSGLTALAAQSGMPAAQARACLANPAAIDRMMKMVEAAVAKGVTGTPVFYLDGYDIGTQNWASLEPILRAAAG